MRLAIIGSGISGLTAARILSPDHEVTLFEANDYLGGHTHTVDVQLDGRTYAIDTGFIVYNEANYPNFTRLLAQLGVESQPTAMSFSVRCDDCGLEYNGRSINSLFAQRRNLLRADHYRMIRDVLRFNREAVSLLDAEDDTLTVGDYVRQAGYGTEFIDHYLLPMGAALWSCSPGTLRSFPARFLVSFFHNHGMMTTGKRPHWRVVRGGSRTYVAALVRELRAEVRVACPVRGVRRAPDRVEVVTEQGDESFEQVIFACHSDQALRILEDPSPTEQELLSAFPYQRNEICLHGDPRVLPRNRLAWASWNYYRTALETKSATLTYNMNILQGMEGQPLFCVTVNESAPIDPALVYARFVYDHPLYTNRRAEAWRRHGELINVNRTSFCGAYWGYGFHEDGVNSALAVCRRFGKGL